MDEFNKIASQFGIAAAMLAALAFAVFLAARWGARKADWFLTEIVRPAVERHLELVSTVKDAAQQNAVTQSQQTRILANIEDELKTQSGQMKVYANKMDESIRAVKEETAQLSEHSFKVTSNHGLIIKNQEMIAQAQVTSARAQDHMVELLEKAVKSDDERTQPRRGK